ncbi:AarF/UbiB family protein [Streptomyces sp. NPDC002088]|uniref:ABC1 kinase family protein n=1 Tax=Streptomyces sp. NPDC002088 TaxID=3154665 RepID=UPI0033295A0B
MARMVGNRLRTVAKVLGHLIAEDVGWSRAHRSEAHSGLEREQRRAKAVRQALESLGPFYVKIGQILSTRPDMVSPTMIAEFENMHDEVDVQPFHEFEPVLAENLGPNWKRLFDDIDTLRPLGAASLAQVHRVTLSGGRLGVIKLQRPGIRETVLADMALLRRAARMVARGAPRFSSVVDLESMLGNIFDAMEPELDFTKEAANMDQARASVGKFRYLAVPEVVAATPGVLVQSMAPGTSVGRIDPATLGDRERMAIGRELLAFMYRGYFIDRFYHADPHPGNVFVAPGGPATLIDWGMVGRIDQRTSMRLLLALAAVGQNDGHGLAKAWTEMGRTTPWSDIPGFSSDMAALVPKVAFASLADLNFGVVLTSCLEKASRRGIASSPSISLLGKSFANLEGSVRRIAPELVIRDVFEKEIYGIILNLIRETLSPQQMARRSLEGLLACTTAGEQLRALADDMSNRQISVQVSQVRRGRALGGENPSSQYRGLLVLGALALYVSRRTSGRS